jgi:hypothetical protein
MEGNMERYANLGGDSNVYAYELGADYTRVQFMDGSVYLYNVISAGWDNIRQMHMLARTGQGLNSFINRHVRKRYARKER